MARSKNTALRFQNIATRRATSLQTHPRQPLMGRGRGNLRENREDPAPTVGRSEDAIAIQMSSHRRRHAHTVHPACHPPMGTYNLYHDAARRIATNASPPHMRMRAPPPPYAPTTRIAHINVRPHGLCSDEACRGAPRRDPPSWLPPMGTLRFFQRRGTPRRYGLREMELVIETSLPVRRISYKRLSPPPGLSPRSLLE